MSPTPSGGWGVCGVFPSFLLLVGWLLGGGSPTTHARMLASLAGPTTESDSATEAQPVRRAYVRGNRCRLVRQMSGERVLLTARWKSPALEGRGLSYSEAIVTYAQLPTSAPEAGMNWREAVVLDPKTWRALARDTVQKLVSLTPHLGTYIQVSSSEFVLYRDAKGQLIEVTSIDVPDHVSIVRRANSEEFALAMMHTLERELRSRYPDQRHFVLSVELTDGHEDFILVDLDRRRTVYLPVPLASGDPRQTSQVALTAGMLGSLILESHVVAIIKNPVSSVARLFNMACQTARGVFPLRARPSNGPLPPLNTGPPMDLAAWEKTLDRLTKRTSDLGSARLLINGEEFFPRFEERLEAAERGIDLLACIFDRDDVAVGIADRLRRKSEEVVVRVRMDRLSSQMSGVSPPSTPMPAGFSPPRSIAAYLERGSRVRVRPFLNTWFTADHSKVYLIDARYAYVGGMNLGREYRYEWHDFMIELEGPVVTRLQRDFDRRWAHSGLGGDIAYVRQAACQTKLRPPSTVSEKWFPIRRLYTKTANVQIRRAVLTAIRRAQSYVYLENPYLYDNAVVGALAQARRRGVDVRVVLPNRSDRVGGNRSNFVTANYLIRNGVRVFLYPGMTHVKALLADGWACLGSANFNKLSLRTNHETNIASSAAELAIPLRQRLFEVDFAKSHELSKPFEVGWTDGVAEAILSQF